MSRVGLRKVADGGILEMRYTSGATARFDECVFRNSGVRTANAGCVNLGLEVISILAEARAFGYERILILENDIAFLKNLGEIEATLAAIPEIAADIIQMDNFVVPGGASGYQWLKANCPLGPRFFSPHGWTFYSGACFGLSKLGIEKMLNELIIRGPQPPDSLFVPLEQNGLKRAIANRNVAIQLVYSGSVSADLFGINSHHDGYKRGGVEYERYNLPDGYTWGSAL